jgi:peptide/nickel transport system permease protein
VSWTQYILRRLSFVAVSLLILSALIFLIMEVVPGDLAQTILGRGATPEQVAALRAQLDLDQPAPARYVEWLGGVVRGDFGESISLHSEIAPLLVKRASNSLFLAALAAVAGLSLSISLGFLAGIGRPRWLDFVVSRTSVIVGSLPEFLVAMLLILVLAEGLGWLPATSLSTTASPLEKPASLVLPALTLVVVMTAYNLRITRASVVKVLDTEYIVAAELKQLPTLTLVRRHIAPNALLPTITVAASYLGWMVGGLIVIEAVFAYPGIGLLILGAARSKDVPLLEGAVLLIAAFRMFVNLGADVLYMVIDPRVRPA